MNNNTYHWIGGAIIMIASMYLLSLVKVIGANFYWYIIVSIVLSYAICFVVGFIWEVIQKKFKFGNANFPDVLRFVKGASIGLIIYLSYISTIGIL